MTQWLAGHAAIDLRMGGTYELSGHLVDRPLAEPVGGPIVGLEEEYVLRVGWRLPSALGAGSTGTPAATTLVALFQPLGPNRTRLRLEHDGWGDGAAWTAALAWQTAVWTEVMSRLKNGKIPA